MTDLQPVRKAWYDSPNGTCGTCGAAIVDDSHGAHILADCVRHLAREVDRLRDGLWPPHDD